MFMIATLATSVRVMKPHRDDTNNYPCSYAFIPNPSLMQQSPLLMIFENCCGYSIHQRTWNKTQNHTYFPFVGSQFDNQINKQKKRRCQKVLQKKHYPPIRLWPIYPKLISLQNNLLENHWMLISKSNWSSQIGKPKTQKPISTITQISQYFHLQLTRLPQIGSLAGHSKPCSNSPPIGTTFDSLCMKEPCPVLLPQELNWDLQILLH